MTLNRSAQSSTIVFGVYGSFQHINYCTSSTRITNYEFKKNKILIFFYCCFRIRVRAHHLGSHNMQSKPLYLRFFCDVLMCHLYDYGNGKSITPCTCIHTPVMIKLKALKVSFRRIRICFYLSFRFFVFFLLAEL